jgi:hypothetical protein
METPAETPFATPEAESEFVNFLRVEQERGVDPTLEDRRAVALDFYQGQPFGDEVEGRSQAVTRDVSEVVDFMTVGILGTIVASGRVVEFETEPEPDEEAAQQAPQAQTQPGPDGQPQQPQKPPMVDYGEEATAAIQYQFMKKGNGYIVLHTGLKAGLLEKAGVCKTYVEHVAPLHETRKALAGEIEIGDDGPHIQGVPVVKADPLDEGWEAGMPSTNWQVTLALPQPPKFCDQPVPNEFFRVAPDAITLDDAIYVGERMPKTLSDLVKLGYDPEELNLIWSGAPADTVVETARDSERSQSRLTVGQRTGANKLLWLDEEYPLYDLDGDGIAERLFVHRIGNRILKVMPVDEQPYSLWCPFPMQHRLVGQSIADKTMDIQRIRSVLLRQALDSLYISNSPRTLVDEGSITVDTIDDLLTVRPGGLIRYKNIQPQPLAQTDTSATSFQGMEMMSSERESRTGVTRQSQGLNPDTMNKTATGLALNIASSQQIELYITRNFAEMYVLSIFAKRYRLMRKYGQPFKMKIEGKYVMVDPRKWPEEIDMSITVGLGTGNKDERLQYRMSLLNIQKESMMAGLRIVGEEQIYQNIRGLVQDSGIGSPSQYVLDPSSLPPAEPRPDPEMAKTQAEAQQAQQDAQNAHDQAMASLQLQQEKQQAESALKAQSSDQDRQIKAEAAQQAANLANAKAVKEAQLADGKAAFEESMAERKFQFDQEMARKKHDLMAQNAALSNDRPGGSLAE